MSTGRKGHAPRASPWAHRDVPRSPGRSVTDDRPPHALHLDPFRWWATGDEFGWILQAAQARADAAGDIDWLVSADSSIVHAHQQGAPGARMFPRRPGQQDSSGLRCLRPLARADGRGRLHQQLHLVHHRQAAVRVQWHRQVRTAQGSLSGTGRDASTTNTASSTEPTTKRSRSSMLAVTAPTRSASLHVGKPPVCTRCARSLVTQNAHADQRRRFHDPATVPGVQPDSSAARGT